MKLITTILLIALMSCSKVSYVSMPEYTTTGVGAEYAISWIDTNCIPEVITGIDANYVIEVITGEDGDWLEIELK